MVAKADGRRMRIGNPAEIMIATTLDYMLWWVCLQIYVLPPRYQQPQNSVAKIIIGMPRSVKRYHNDERPVCGLVAIADGRQISIMAFGYPAITLIRVVRMIHGQPGPRGVCVGPQGSDSSVNTWQGVGVPAHGVPIFFPRQETNSVLVGWGQGWVGTGQHLAGPKLGVLDRVAG
jgi:hypothetical protein